MKSNQDAIDRKWKRDEHLWLYRCVLPSDTDQSELCHSTIFTLVSQIQIIHTIEREKACKLNLHIHAYPCIWCIRLCVLSNLKCFEKKRAKKKWHKISWIRSEIVRWVRGHAMAACSSVRKATLIDNNTWLFIDPIQYSAFSIQLKQIAIAYAIWKLINGHYFFLNEMHVLLRSSFAQDVSQLSRHPCTYWNEMFWIPFN